MEKARNIKHKINLSNVAVVIIFFVVIAAIAMSIVLPFCNYKSGYITCKNHIPSWVCNTYEKELKQLNAKNCMSRQELYSFDIIDINGNINTVYVDSYDYNKYNVGNFYKDQGE